MRNARSWLRPSPQALTGVFATLLRKMDGVKQMANDQERSVFCWASGNLGFNCSQIFGPPTANVDPQLAQSLFQRLSALGQQSGFQCLSRDPFPLLRRQQALPPDVCAELIRKADQEGLWQNSTVVGGSRQVVMNNIRTSATATFNLPHHEEKRGFDYFKHTCEDELLYGIRSWAAQLLGLPTDFVEPLQIARYSCGQEYKRHFDWRSANFNGIWIFGQRVATILVYLKTLPAGAGGETEFNQLNLQVTPVEGTAAIWPNVDVAGCPNVATSHLAKPVLQDLPLGAVQDPQPPGPIQRGLDPRVMNPAAMAALQASFGAGGPMASPPWSYGIPMVPTPYAAGPPPAWWPSTGERSPATPETSRKGGGPKKRGNEAGAGHAGADAAHHSGDTLRMHLRSLLQVDSSRVLIVRKINRLGFSSPQILKEHFSWYGTVENVLVAHSRVKSGGGQNGIVSRLRPSGLGFVVMGKGEEASKILAEGPEQQVQGTLASTMLIKRCAILASWADKSWMCETGAAQRPL
eukprot:g33147.t1